MCFCVYVFCHAADGPQHNWSPGQTTEFLLPQMVPLDQVWQTMAAIDGPALLQVVPCLLHAISYVWNQIMCG